MLTNIYSLLINHLNYVVWSQSEGHNSTHTPEATEELERDPEHSECKSAMESDASLMRGGPVSSRLYDQTCLTIRKVSDSDQLHYTDITFCSKRTCSHCPPCLTSARTDSFYCVVVADIELNTLASLPSLYPLHCQNDMTD